MKKIVLLLFFIFLMGIVFAESNKVFIIAFRYEDGQLLFHDKMVKYGYNPDKDLMIGDYSGDIVSVDDEILYSFNFNVPMTEFVDVSDINTGKISGGIVKVDETRFAIVLPYYEKAKSIKIYDPGAVEVLDIGTEETEGINYGLLINILIFVLISGLIIAIGIRRRKLYK